MIGRFHEISVHAPDVLASLDFYERLGFTQAPAGEAWPYPYAVVSDGRLAIGLHGRELPQSPLLAFVLPGLLARLADLEARGIEIVERRLGHDVFNEASFEMEGQRVRLLEARTHSPAPRAPGETTKLGWFEEFAVPVDDAPRAARAWESLGFVAAEESGESLPRVTLTSDSLNIALLQRGVLPRPALRFTDRDPCACLARLEQSGFGTARRPSGGLDPARHALLVAPEGTQILLSAGE